MKHSFAYLSQNRFLGIPALAADAAASRPFAVAGIPYDGAVTNRPGARFCNECGSPLTLPAGVAT